jgi:SnoaL-like domain
MIESSVDIAELLAEREILRTMHRYAHTLDYGDVDGFVDCFVEKPDYRFSSRSGGSATNAEELAGFVRRYRHAPEQFNKHVMIDPIITVTGDRATVTSYYLFIQDGASGPHIASYGRYADVLVRCDDRRWRFESRHIQNEAMRPGFIPPVAPVEEKYS